MFSSLKIDTQGNKIITLRVEERDIDKFSRFLVVFIVLDEVLKSSKILNLKSYLKVLNITHILKDLSVSFQEYYVVWS